MKEDTERISLLEIILVEIKGKRKRTKSIIEQLKRGKYYSNILNTLFNYDLFQKVINGNFDKLLKDQKEQLKKKAQEYISIAKTEQERIKKFASTKGITRRLKTSTRLRIALAQGGKSFEEKIDELKDQDIKMYIESDEESKILTFSALARIKYETEGHLLYTLSPKEKSKIVRFN